VKTKSRKHKEALRPYKDVIIFMLTLFAVNYFWKFTVKGDEYGNMVTWFGLDVTAPFEFMACHVASAVYWLVSLFRDNVELIDQHIIRYDNGVGTTIVWGCSGLKQMFIWTFLILTVRDVRKADKAKSPITNHQSSLLLRKLCYIPFGWICCHAFNILRIFLITLMIENHPTWFHPLHDYVFKYAFYGMLFLLWVVFIEKIRPSKETDSVVK
jgi:exosortase/archaeosortase family protein